jgi:signal transduction histidine kinase
MTSLPRPGADSPEEGAGQRSQDLFEHAPLGLCEVNAAGIIVAINQTLLGWLARARPEVVDQQTVEDLVSPDSLATLHLLTERCRSAGRVNGVTLLWQGPKEGQYWSGEVTATAAYDTQGQWAGWRGCIQEVPVATVELERLLQERTLEAIERLASGVAHKFNNLLQVIQGYAELGLITLEPSHPVHSHLARIKEATQRAAGLVQGLVTFSRRRPLRRRSLDLSSFITQLGVRLLRLVPPGVELRLAPSVESIHVLADAASLEQALIQVVQNACEAMPQGGVVALETRLVEGGREEAAADSRSGPSVCISVSDTGTGIAPRVVGQIFEPFFTTKDTANGLGLAVVWGVVKQHGGRVEVGNQPDRGATFRIYLPVAEVTSA